MPIIFFIFYELNMCRYNEVLKKKKKKEKKSLTHSIWESLRGIKNLAHYYLVSRLAERYPSPSPHRHAHK